MIDLHCHILPAVDDGSDDLESSCLMGELAVQSGVDTVVATPHCNLPAGQKNYRSPVLDRAFAALQRALDESRLPLRVLPGCEVLLHGDVEALLDRQQLYTLNGSRYLLVEFYFNEHPRFMDDALDAVSAHGYVPLVAHPERYFCVQDMPGLAADWVRRGYALQLNKGSVLGDLGEGAYDASRELLRRGLCHVIASDAHHFAYRTPSMTRLLDELEFFFPELDPMRLLEENPRRIIRNEAPLL